MYTHISFYPHHTPYAASTFIISFSAHSPIRTLRHRGSSCPYSCVEEIQGTPFGGRAVGTEARTGKSWPTPWPTDPGVGLAALNGWAQATIVESRKRP